MLECRLHHLLLLANNFRYLLFKKCFKPKLKKWWLLFSFFVSFSNLISTVLTVSESDRTKSVFFFYMKQSGFFLRKG